MSSVHITSATFEGPFDLLVSLIEDKKMAISDVSLSVVTEQYLQYIEQHAEISAEDVSDFLVVATKLVLHKSRQLIPQFFPEEEDGPSLEKQLSLYKAFVEASAHIQRYWEKRTIGFFRHEPLRKNEEFVPPKNATQYHVHNAMLRLVKRLTPRKPLPQVRMEETQSVKEKISEIRQVLRRASKIHFSQVVGNTKTKSDIILGFLAVLELVKQEDVTLQQDHTYGDIIIST
ncbi:MAG: segregation/condensation protein A [Candidatus Magasanikbacteria bacterium]|mgnify:CR=1 FL=1|jgi:segregation and condensation protein A|nr:segregation/condensation protein A [Candidatus Magasanikbacteria bacterium]MBT5262976.1 segregation/condensation protein A [Candidatus Magasanikbacteria bacterium]MBT5820654.1 segregation/condensation protein A [Candidatus Magasanikbacteria bacterium]MBT6294350.1 segregation/condensation protein A [Candidatus Magasanikbacteria bacterium]